MIAACRRKDCSMIFGTIKLEPFQIIVGKCSELGCIGLLGLRKLLMRGLAVHIDGHLVIIKLISNEDERSLDEVHAVFTVYASPLMILVKGIEAVFGYEILLLEMLECHLHVIV